MKFYNPNTTQHLKWVYLKKKFTYKSGTDHLNRPFKTITFYWQQNITKLSELKFKTN